jgi:transcriptional regulator with XRE-family HTH domain
MAESDLHNQELPMESVGARLRRSREKADLTLSDIASRTKIAERHLASIEEGRFGDLASRTYAVGFARAYAREVGLDEGQVAQAVRDELAETDRISAAAKADAFEPGDPARVPGSGIALVAGLGAVVAIVLVAVFWRSFFSPAASLPELTTENEAVAAVAPATPPSAAAAVVPGGPVVFTALAPNIWVKFYDAAGNQLMQKLMVLGESYTVPADANGPMIRTARPDALRITVGGRNVPKLADDAVIIADVPVSAAALLARAAPAPTPVKPSVNPPANPGTAGLTAGQVTGAAVPHQAAVAAPPVARPSAVSSPRASTAPAPAASRTPAAVEMAGASARPEPAVTAERPAAAPPAVQPASIEAETSTVSQ